MNSSNYGQGNAHGDRTRPPKRSFPADRWCRESAGVREWAPRQSGLPTILRGLSVAPTAFAGLRDEMILCDPASDKGPARAFACLAVALD